MQFLLYIMVGIAGGLISGLFGVGGGVVIIPALLLGFGFAQHMAQGTMLATFVLPTFVLAVWKYYQAGNINIPAALLISLGMMIGAALGAAYVQSIPGPVLKKMFGVLMVLIGVRLFLGK